MSRVDGIVARVLNNVVVWLQNLVDCGEYELPMIRGVIQDAVLEKSNHSRRNGRKSPNSRRGGSRIKTLKAEKLHCPML